MSLTKNVKKKKVVDSIHTKNMLAIDWHVSVSDAKSKNLVCCLIVRVFTDCHVKILRESFFEDYKDLKVYADLVGSKHSKQKLRLLVKSIKHVDVEVAQIPYYYDTIK